MTAIPHGDPRAYYGGQSMNSSVSRRQCCEWLAGTLALIAALGLSLGVAAETSPVVDAPAGAVRGKTLGTIHAFRGIPFALPPTGERRWKPPVPVPRWTATRDATRYGPACVQPPSRAESIYAWDLPAMSEDCLSLNIWAPARVRGA